MRGEEGPVGGGTKKRVRQWGLWASAWLSAGVAVATLGLFYFNQTRVAVPDLYHPKAMNTIIALTFPFVGALILGARPRHPIGWIFLAGGWIQSLAMFSVQYGFYALEIRDGAVPFGVAAFYLREYLYFPGFALLAVLLAIFPDGMLPSPRWRWVLRLTAASVAIFTLSVLIEPFTDPQVTRFLAEPVDVWGVSDVVFDLSLILLLISLGAAIVALLLRLKRSQGTERQQLKWFAFAGFVFFTCFMFISVLSAWPVLEPEITARQWYGPAMTLARVLFPLSMALIPLSVGIAILRYRLYEIDLIIRKTIIYSILTLILGATYALSIILLQSVSLRLTGTEQPEVATVLSTLTIAAFFAPLRERVQDEFDQRFYRRRYNAEQSLASFSAALREEVEMEALVGKIEALAIETLQPELVSIWLRPADDPGRMEGMSRIGSN